MRFGVSFTVDSPFCFATIHFVSFPTFGFNGALGRVKNGVTASPVSGFVNGAYYDFSPLIRKRPASGTNDGCLYNPFDFGYHQLPSHRLEVACLMLRISNVCNQAEMKGREARWNARGFQAEQPGKAPFCHHLYHFLGTRNKGTLLTYCFFLLNNKPRIGLLLQRV